MSDLSDIEVAISVLDERAQEITAEIDRLIEERGSLYRAIMSIGYDALFDDDDSDDSDDEDEDEVEIVDDEEDEDDCDFCGGPCRFPACSCA